MAEWLTKWPATGGSAYEKLQGALRRVPDTIAQLKRLAEPAPSRMTETSADSRATPSHACRRCSTRWSATSAGGWTVRIASRCRLIARATLEGMVGDLRRQADALDVDRPLLVIMLMGGTGVGKSTLLNALAGGAIAQASFTRPTTRDPVVYYHESVKPDRLDPALRHCRLVPHDRADLLQKIIVDTPDLDSNDLANREKLQALLPVADIVLYVGSQEKYHDQLGWDLFKEQRKRRAFAFVLNKWDRCLQPGATGLRPDEDLLRDLKAEGFDSPLLFRTVAQAWVGMTNGSVPSESASGRAVSRVARLARNGTDAPGDRGAQGARRRSASIATRPDSRTSPPRRSDGRSRADANRLGITSARGSHRGERGSGHHAGAIFDRNRTPLPRRRTAQISRADGRLSEANDEAALRRHFVARSDSAGPADPPRKSRRRPTGTWRHSPTNALASPARKC